MSKCEKKNKVESIKKNGRVRKPLGREKEEHKRSKRSFNTDEKNTKSGKQRGK